MARDLSIGRIYLPREDRRRFGYTDDDLHRRVTNEAFVSLMRFEVVRARKFLYPWSSAMLPELCSLPWRLQVDIELFARGGEKILDRIEAIGYRVWDKRPVVTKTDVLRLFAGCLWRTVRRRRSGRIY